MPLSYRNVQVITVSPSSKEEIIKHKLTKKEPLIIYNGIDPNIFKPAKKSENPLVIYLGRLMPYKNIDVAIKAFEQVVTSYPTSRLVVVGEGESGKDLEKLTIELSLEKSITFTGRITNLKKAELLAKSWVAIQPSMFEGWGITVIEANAAGTPVIASNVIGLKDSVVDGQTGTLVKAKDIDEFAKAITDFLLDEEYRKTLSENAHNWSKKFSWDKSANDFYELITKEVKAEKESYSVRKYALLINKINSLF